MNAVRKTSLGIATLGLLVGLSGCGQNPMSPIATSESNAVRSATPTTSADQMSMPIDEATPPTGGELTQPTPPVSGGSTGGNNRFKKPKKGRGNHSPGGGYGPVP